MSWLSSFGSSLLGTVTNTLAGNWSAHQNAKLARQNWTYQQQNAHQYEVEDLRKAGLNPILSATNSQIAGMSNVSGSSVSDNGVYSAETNKTSALQAKAVDAQLKGLELENDNKRIENEIRALDLQEKEVENNIRIGDSTVRLNDSSVIVNSARAEQIKQDTKNSIVLTEAQVRQINAEISNSTIVAQAQAANLYSGATLNYKNAEYLSAQIVKTVEETAGIRLSNQQLNNILTDPAMLEERKLLADGLKDNNVLGALVKIGIGAKYLGGTYQPLLPGGSSISFGRSGARYGMRN